MDQAGKIAGGVIGGIIGVSILICLCYRKYSTYRVRQAATGGVRINTESEAEDLRKLAYLRLWFVPTRSFATGAMRELDYMLHGPPPISADDGSVYRDELELEEEGVDQPGSLQELMALQQAAHDLGAAASVPEEPEEAETGGSQETGE